VNSFHSILSWLIVLLLLTSTINADMITKDDFLEQLKTSHPLFEKEKLTAQIARQEQAAYLGNRDWNVSSSLFYSQDEPSFAVAGPEKTDAISISGGLKKAFWSTGGRISASYSSNHASLTSNPAFGLPESYFENRLAVTYSHPLLKNNGGVLDRLQYELSQFDIDISEEIALENEELFLAQSVSKFLDWVFLIEQHRIVTERLRLSEEELNRVRDKRAANMIDEVDVLRAEDAVRITRQNLLLVESQSKALQAELAVLLQDNAVYELTPQFSLYETTMIPSATETTVLLKNNSRLIKAINIRMDQQRLLGTGFAEQGKTDLALVAQVGLKNAETSYGRSLAMDIPEARLGLQLGFPVGQRTAKANVARTDLVVMQLERQSQQILLDLSSAAANLLTQVKELQNVLKLNQEQIESAQRKTTEELKLYNQGRGELTFVIQSRDSEQAARLTYAVNALTYHKLLLQLQELTDQLHSQIEITE